ncbi:hypothetical protein P4E94_08895 [Pontiellaceae bacterium B12219]|nr:hypothetical protein [Pontiellaceae bacterium B12219]
MKTRGKIKPSKSSSFMQMIMGGIFAIIGVTVLIPTISKDNDGPVWFGLLWTGGALLGAIFGAINLFTDEGIPTEEFSYTTTLDDDKQQPVPGYRSVESRLNEIKKLKDKNLISHEEYEIKRSKILNEI